jgi:hypothetical protein
MADVRWAYGVTTCVARKGDLLPRTLESLAAGGFPSPRLFVDGASPAAGVSYADHFKLEVTTRWPTIRTAGNFCLGLAELYFREPAADRYAMFQDDLVCCRNLRRYLESCVVASRAYWNLYLFPENQRLAPRVGQTARFYEGWYPSNQKGKGAVALVFTNEGVRTLLSHTHLIERPRDLRRGHRAIDGGIVTALKKAGWREFVHSPSLVQHVGLISSMGNRPHPKANNFPGEEADALDLLRNPDRIPPAV